MPPPAISALKFPCYARHIQPNGPDKNGRGEINVPIYCGRQVVNTGDIIVGDADQVEPESFLRREFESRIPGTEFIILPGVGHLAPLEAPNELAAGIAKAVSRMI